MQKRIFRRLMIGVTALVFINPLQSQGLYMGKVIEGLSHDSKILNKKVNYSVYLPAGYEHSNRSYPIVYLLHGYTDNETAWVQFGEVNLAADQAIANREIPPMIIVMPDGGVSFYINNYNKKVRYEDMFFEEFVPFVESRYRVREGKEFRGIAGLSMGGYGTLIYSIRHPEMFSSCAALSAATRDPERALNLDQEEYDRVFGPVFGPGLEGQERLTDHFKEYSVIVQAGSRKPEELKKVRYYIDCGDDDFLINGNMHLHEIFKEKGIPHEFRVRNGGHTWEYWRTGIVDGLKFIGEGFHR